MAQTGHSKAPSPPSAARRVDEGNFKVWRRSEVSPLFSVSERSIGWLDWFANYGDAVFATGAALKQPPCRLSFSYLVESFEIADPLKRAFYRRSNPGKRIDIANF